MMLVSEGERGGQCESRSIQERMWEGGPRVAWVPPW